VQDKLIALCLRHKVSFLIQLCEKINWKKRDTCLLPLLRRFICWSTNLSSLHEDVFFLCMKILNLSEKLDIRRGLSLICKEMMQKWLFKSLAADASIYSALKMNKKFQSNPINCVIKFQLCPNDIKISLNFSVHQFQSLL
jgi:hypothetical protein